MNISKKAEIELVEGACSEDFRSDMQGMRDKWHSPFIINGNVDVDAYLDFVTEYNEFINHRPRQFKKIEDKYMKL
jgi:hypothetical protein